MPPVYVGVARLQHVPGLLDELHQALALLELLALVLDLQELQQLALLRRGEVGVVYVAHSSLRSTLMALVMTWACSSRPLALYRSRMAVRAMMLRSTPSSWGWVTGRPP